MIARCFYSKWACQTQLGQADVETCRISGKSKRQCVRIAFLPRLFIPDFVSPLWSRNPETSVAIVDVQLLHITLLHSRLTEEELAFWDFTETVPTEPLVPTL